MKEREAETRLLDSLQWQPAGTAVCAIHQQADEPVAQLGDGRNAPFGCRSCMQYAMRIESGMAECRGEVSAVCLPDWTTATV